MGDSELRSKLCELLGALTNREITPEQHRELDQLLAESKQAREIYLDYMDLDFELREMHAADDIPKALLSLQQLVELETVPADTCRDGAPLARLRRRGRRDPVCSNPGAFLADLR
jgi:hypothetical protein